MNSLAFLSFALVEAFFRDGEIASDRGSTLGPGQKSSRCIFGPEVREGDESPAKVKGGRVARSLQIAIFEKALAAVNRRAQDQSPCLSPCNFHPPTKRKS